MIDDWSSIDVESSIGFLLRSRVSRLSQSSSISPGGSIESIDRFLYYFSTPSTLSQSYDGGFGQAPSQESHGRSSLIMFAPLSLIEQSMLILPCLFFFLTGGSTYCALAALSLSNNLNRLSKQQREATIKWLISRQSELYHLDQDQLGFNGRIGKPSDSCYSFWCGAALKVRLFELVS